MKKLIPLLLLSLPVKAAIITAASCSYTDVTNAVAHASHGDTVQLPFGTGSWGQMITISGITLQGSGTNNTLIIDNSPQFTSATTLTLACTNGFLTRVTGIQFTYTNTAYNNFSGMVEVSGGSPFWRIDNNYFNNTSAKSIRIKDDSYGLIDDNLFVGCAKQYIEVFGAGFGDSSWALPDTMGTTNAVVIESNTFYDTCRFGSTDTDNGGRICFRFNTLNGTFFTVHGTETGQRFRGCRQLEVYNNTFFYLPSGPYDDFYTTCDIRGGTGVIFSNDMKGYYTSVTVSSYRETDNDLNFTPWFGASGINGYDSNSPTALFGTASATSNKLYVASAAWSINQWSGYTVYNSNSINGLKVFGIVSSSDANTMSFVSPRTAQYTFYITNGDPFSVHIAYPTIDMLGRGQGNDLGSTNTPFPAYPMQQLDPLYFWSNNLSLYGNGFYQPQPPQVGSAYPQTKSGRDYYNDIVKPGYTPLIYPHPMINNPAPPIVVASGVQFVGQVGQISNMH